MNASEPNFWENEKPSWRAAFASMAVCGLLFEVLYNFCNWITALRDDVPTLAFDWETQIPFVPAMIVPYWTLNLFFVGSFFVCSTRGELRILRTRIALAILTACTCFLLFPLQLAFPRPEVDGFYGLLFDALRSFDKPHNLAPSLHVALRTIVWPIYIPRTRGWLNVALRVWFVLIGVSTLLTYQHQAIDVATGWLLAIFCLYVVAAPNHQVDRTICVRNGRVGLYYVMASTTLGTLGFLLRPWGAILFWNAAATAIMAGAYFALGASVFRKLDGKLARSSRLLLGPVLLGHWLSLRHYQRQCRPWDQAAANVWIGRRLTTSEARQARSAGVAATLDLTAEFSEAAPLLETTYLNIPILDLTAPTEAQLRRAAEFIEHESRLGIVYVHCKIGYSRSVAVVGAYLLHSRQARSVEEAVAMLRRVRPSIVVRPEIWRALEQFQTVQNRAAIARSK